MVEHQLPKLRTRVRFPSSAPCDVARHRELVNPRQVWFGGCCGVLSVRRWASGAVGADGGVECECADDFGRRRRGLTADSKSRYFFREFGWADLLASLPFEQLKILRVFRVLRVFRLLRAYGAKNIARSLVKDRAGSALYVLLLMGILVLEFGSLAILRLEQDAAGANITTGSDAIWYVIVTISTVGYGDQFPVTNRGRLFGALIIVIGVGIFGTFTGYLANFFLTPPKKATVAETPADAEVDVRSKVAELRELIAHQQAQQQAAMDEIERLLAPDGV